MGEGQRPAHNQRHRDLAPFRPQSGPPCIRKGKIWSLHDVASFSSRVVPSSNAPSRATPTAAGGAKWASTELAKATGELKQIVGSAYDQFAQRGREWGALLIGAVLGFVSWWPLAWGLPWDWGGRLASTLVAGQGRWGAGETLMREAEPDAWRRMARLYNACPTELCEAAMAAKTIPPGQRAQPAPVPGKAKPTLPAGAPVPSSRGKAAAGR